MGLRDFTIYDFIRSNASLAASTPAVITADQTLSHLQFLERVDQLASGLTAHGISKGDRICILAQNSGAYLDLYGACAKIGAVAYPINWRLSPMEVKAVLELADPTMLVVGIGHLPQLQASDTSGYKVRAILGSGTAESFIPLSDLYQTPTNDHTDARSDDPFVIISTAAVAGVPRGAILTHANLIMGGYQLINAIGLAAEDRHLAALPLFHITGLGLSLSMIQVGGTNVGAAVDHAGEDPVARHGHQDHIDPRSLRCV